MRRLSTCLTLGEAAEHPGIDEDTIRLWDGARKLTGRRHRLSLYRLYVRKDADALLSVGRRDRETCGNQDRRAERKEASRGQR